MILLLPAIITTHQHSPTPFTPSALSTLAQPNEHFCSALSPEMLQASFLAFLQKYHRSSFTQMLHGRKYGTKKTDEDPNIVPLFILADIF